MSEPGASDDADHSMPLLSHPAPGVALLELNRPAAANRLQPEDLALLLRHLDACERDPAINALVFTARGPHFSAGYDLRALTSALQSGDRQTQGDVAFETLADRLEASRLVSVVSINGPVLGGATDLALACDLRIGSAAAQMQMPAARFGLPLYAGALQRYVSRLGVDVAKRLVLLAQKIDATEMLRIGFLSELVSAAELQPRALDIGCQVAAMPAEALAAMKRVLNASALGRGTAPEQRAALAAALQPQQVAARILSLRRPRADTP